jgi:hypothetical protein
MRSMAEERRNEELRAARAPYLKPSLVRYRPQESPAEYLVASGGGNASKCGGSPPGCGGRRRGLDIFAPPPWG